MQSRDWGKVLNACVLRLATDLNFALMYTQTGVPPQEWPECLAKELALRFYERKSEKSLQAAMISLFNAVENLPQVELSHVYSLAYEEINYAIKTGIGLQLAEKIKTYPAQVFELINHQTKITHQDTSVDLKMVANEAYTRMLSTLGTEKTTIRTIPGFPLLSSLIGGFNDARVTLFVAGSGVGKTTLMLNMVLSAIQKFPCLFVNMEMSIDDMLRRIACIIGGVPQHVMDNLSQRTAEAMSKASNFLYQNENLFMTDGNNLTLEQIISTGYKRASQGARFLIVDYDQKIKTSGDDQEWKEILHAVEALEDLAKRTKMHVIILSQGDENNNPKASKRSVQPCSAVLAFYQDGDKYYLESKKNRFGRKFKLEMDCDFATYSVKELQEVSSAKDPLEFLRRG